MDLGFFFFWVLSVLFVSFKYAATDFLLVFIYSNLEVGLILFFVGFFFLGKKKSNGLHDLYN